MTLLPPVIPDYELLRRIGRGSYGDVWLGRSVTGQYRAVKVVYRDRFESDRPFEREFAGIQKFEAVAHRHPSQLDVLHVGRNGVAGFFFYVMELADDASEAGSSGGQGIDPASYEPLTLKTVLERRRPLPAAEVLELAEPLVEALQQLHAEGLIHRDIKPSNIIFVRGRPKLADIGLITTVAASVSFVGTEGFVPPEGPGTVAADVYAVGKVLYEAATGRDRTEFPQLPERLEMWPDRGLLMELNEVWLKACDPVAKHRYATAADLRNDLVLLKARKSVRRLRLLERQVRRGRTVMAGIAALGLVIGYGWWQSHRFNRYAASQLAHVQVQHGQERLEKGDSIGALPWFNSAMALEHFDARRQFAHRLRIANTLASSPELVALHAYLAEPMPRYVYFDATGERALICDPGDTAQVWKIGSEMPATPKLKHGGQVRRGWFNSDATRVATAGADGFVRLWDANSGELKGTPIAHHPNAAAAAFAPGGTVMFTGGADGRVAAWNMDGQFLRAGAIGFPVTELEIASDGRWLAAAGGVDRRLAVVDAASLQPRVPVFEPAGEPRVIAFDAAGARLAVGCAEGLVEVWELGPVAQRSHRFELDGGVFKTDFDREGRHLLAAAERAAGIFDLATARPLFPLVTDVSTFRVAEYSPDEKQWLLAGESRIARVLDAATGEPRSPPLRQAGEIALGQFTPDGTQWLTASADRTTRRWARPAAERDTIRLVHDHDVLDAWFVASPAQVLSLDVDGVPRRWTWTSNRVQSVTGERLGRPQLAQLAADGQTLVVVLAGGTIVASDTSTLATVAYRGLTNAPFHLLAVNPRQPLALVAGPNRETRLWNWHDNHDIALGLGEAGDVLRAVFSPDGATLVVGTSRAELLIWKMEVPARPPVRVELSDRANLLAFSPDGRQLLVAAEDRTFQWRRTDDGTAASGRLRAEAGVNFARASPGAARVFAASVNFEAMMWDTATARPLTRPFQPHGQVVEAVFSPDASQVALISRDGAVQLWHAEFGQPLGPILRGSGPVTNCAFSPDGRGLLLVENRREVVVRPLIQDPPSARELSETAALISAFRLDGDGLPRPVDILELREIDRRRRTGPGLGPSR